LAQKSDCEVPPKATPVRIAKTTIEAASSSSLFISRPTFFSLKVANEVDFIIDIIFFGDLTGSKAFSLRKILLTGFKANINI
jgi:hypothetical protein